MARLITSINCNDSPLFGEIVFAVEKPDLRRLRRFFPELKARSRWVRIHQKRWAESIDLGSLEREIQAKLVDPLFLRPAVNVRHENNCRQHRADNLYCCVDFYRKKLKRFPASELEPILKEFRSSFQRAAPGFRFPFSWMIKHVDPVAKKREKIRERLHKLENQERNILQKPVTEMDQAIQEYEADKHVLSIEKEGFDYFEWLQRSSENMKSFAVRRCKELLEWMKLGRGKRGRHPKPYNVLAYHLVTNRKITSWKFDWKVLGPAGGHPPYMFRKDGQHRLETDWRLLCYLILKIHLRTVPIPELRRFILKYRKKPAAVALRDLKGDLLSRYKNFPPMDARPFPRSHPETGFRKVILTDDGNLEVVTL